MSMIPIEAKDYSDGRTVQAYKEATDINKILQKAQREGTLSHLQRHGAQYADFSDVPDLLTAYERIERGKSVFSELPSEVRSEFGNDMFKFFEFVNDPANAGRLQEVLPKLAEPGRQNPSVRRSAATEANPAIESAGAEFAPSGAEETPVEAPVAPDASSTT